MTCQIQTRPGTNSDESWLYQLYCESMRAHIEKTWGWDEQFQRNCFKSNLLPEKFKIIVFNGKDIGAYLLNEWGDHFWLEMLLVLPNMQNQGIGTKVVNMLQFDSAKYQKPLKLSVIKVNPAKQFYLRLGFEVYEEEENFYKLQWDENKTRRLG